MKQAIINNIKDTIDDIKNKYAINYVAKKELESMIKDNILNDTPENKKKIEACDFNMKKAEEKLELYKTFLSEEK